MDSRGTIDWWIRTDLWLFKILPTEYLAILHAEKEDGTVIYDGQIAPLYQNHRNDILNLAVKSIEMIDYPFPALYFVVVK